MCKARKELAAEICEHVKARLVSYKVPREVRFCSELPKTVTGKIQRFQIAGRVNGFFRTYARTKILPGSQAWGYISENGSGRVIVGVVGRGDGANFSKSLIAQEFPVFEDCFESVVGRDGSALNNFDGGKILAVLNEVEAAALAGFRRIGFGFL